MLNIDRVYTNLAVSELMDLIIDTFGRGKNRDIYFCNGAYIVHGFQCMLGYTIGLRNLIALRFIHTLI